MTTNIYSAGVLYASVCTDDPDDVVIAAVNAEVPHLVPWVISTQPFADGAPNPAPCNHDLAGRRHVLLTVLNEPAQTGPDRSRPVRATLTGDSPQDLGEGNDE
jgi:hypothetical protein